MVLSNPNINLHTILPMSIKSLWLKFFFFNWAAQTIYYQRRTEEDKIYTFTSAFPCLSEWWHQKQTQSSGSLTYVTLELSVIPFLNLVLSALTAPLNHLVSTNISQCPTLIPSLSLEMWSRHQYYLSFLNDSNSQLGSTCT
jgi:uncharacterized BrkB/YihY/UPF0761 family membrane protein